MNSQKILEKEFPLINASLNVISAFYNNRPKFINTTKSKNYEQIFKYIELTLSENFNGLDDIEIIKENTKFENIKHYIFSNTEYKPDHYIDSLYPLHKFFNGKFNLRTIDKMSVIVSFNYLYSNSEIKLIFYLETVNGVDVKSDILPYLDDYNSYTKLEKILTKDPEYFSKMGDFNTVVENLTLSSKKRNLPEEKGNDVYKNSSEKEPKKVVKSAFHLFAKDMKKDERIKNMSFGSQAKEIAKLWENLDQSTLDYYTMLNIELKKNDF